MRITAALAAAAIIVTGVSVPVTAQAKPKKPGVQACEQQPDRIVCDTLPQDGKWERCIVTGNSPKKPKCVSYRTGQSPSDYPPYNIAVKRQGYQQNPAPPTAKHWGPGLWPGN
jgi:hypothetical protein